MNIARLITFLAILFIGSTSFILNEWSLISTKQGIEIYTKHDSKGRNWSKIVTTIDAAPSEVFDYASDISSFKNWIYGCADAKMLDSNTNESTYYYVTDLPFPLTDRDAVINRVYYQNKVTGSYSSHSTLNTNYDMKSDLVRLEEFEAIWFFDAMPGGKTKLTYEIFANPGGSIPTWLAEKFSTNGPFKTMQSLKSHFEK